MCLLMIHVVFVGLLFIFIIISSLVTPRHSGTYLISNKDLYKFDQVCSDFFGVHINICLKNVFSSLLCLINCGSG